MLIEKGPQGQWIISTIIDGHLVIKQFFGFSKDIAIKKFNQSLKKGVKS
jgi:hypothetical protein